MASLPAVLKQQAAALELKKQPEKALALYQQLLSEHGGSEDVDVSLRNRVGDLHLRLGQIDEAILLFERSADEYALSGFLNNAIALCNKILRQRPGHVSTLRRLARFSAEKGMVVDAQRHYLSVAEAFERLGQHGEALKALSEFAELSPDDVHVRSVVIEQLLRADRKPDALPHLSVLHRLHVAAGRSDDADGVAGVARDIDPAWVADAADARAGKRANHSLILIDSDDDFGALETTPMLGGARDRPDATASLAGLELTAPTAPGLTELPTSDTLVGFEATSFDQTDDAPALDDSLLDAMLFDVVPPVVQRPADESPEFIEFLDLERAQPLHESDALFEEDVLGLPAIDVSSGSVFEPLPLDESFGGLPDLAAPYAWARPSGGSPADREGDFVLAGFSPIEPELPASPLAPLPAASAPVVPYAAPVAPERPQPPAYVNLAEHLLDDEPATARMTVGEPQRTGNHAADFQHILQEFRNGLEKSISVDDAESHYDLGIAFREMGLLDDAISEFQTAARSRSKRVGSIEALGGCFLDKGQPTVALTILQRALDDPSVTHADDELRGVLYLLGRASEDLGARDDGLRYYHRVYAVDIRFRDVAVRIQNLQQPA